MNSSDLRREENFNEFLRLQQNDDYIDVSFDEESGGMSAVHKLHKFSKQKGVNGLRQGDYEKTVVEVMRRCGHRVVLGPESNTPGIKSFDGFIDDIPMEIKAVEGEGTWSISTKLQNAQKQKAQCVVLYFTEQKLFSRERVIDGLEKYLANPNTNKEQTINMLLAVSGDALLESWDKKATPIEGWSI